MHLSKILKRNSVVIDNTKKYTIPVPSMPPLEEEIEQEIVEPEEFEFQNFEFPVEQLPKQEQEQEQETEETITEQKIPVPEEKQPETPPQEYDFEDFNFAELPRREDNREDDIDIISRQVREIEKKREESEIEAENMLEDARFRSEEFIQRSVQTAELIITHTLDGAKAELSNAISAGYADGFETGRAEALKIVEPALNKINILMETINRLQDKMLYEFRDSMFNIISEISKKIVHKEISEDNHYLIALFSDAIQDIKAEEFVTVTVAESELAIATRNEKLFLAEIPYIKDFKILSEKNANKGTMIVETEKTVVDSSIDMQLEKVDYYLEMMKENLDIPKTVDDIINQTSLRSIDNHIGMMSDEDRNYPKYDENTDDISNINIDADIDINSAKSINENIGFENIENIDDISDEDLMKYFESPDFNVD